MIGNNAVAAETAGSPNRIKKLTRSGQEVWEYKGVGQSQRGCGGNSDLMLSWIGRGYCHCMVFIEGLH